MFGKKTGNINAQFSAIHLDFNLNFPQFVKKHFNIFYIRNWLDNTGARDGLIPR